ncbi:unnamed protein product [Adineta ricciae]|uniref:G-protein coupled receptors family 1 profile domain-containing protein n=1 Tax=Adineta ricciae TaxID=249248 RepID=A0A815S676_ADIRI|nr:unnamed protein product [Adineta ricciae]CAF1483991.1 unnamed protein product [Adineta ricciae]
MPIIFYFEIANVIDQFGQMTPICNARKGMYRSFHASWHMAVHSLCPCFLMLVFGILTVKNIRQNRRISPLLIRINRHIERHRRTDRQILRMLAVQVLVIIISTTPSCIVRLYSSFTESIIKDAYRIAQENLGTQIANSLSFFAYSSSFYLYTLTGSLFRKELIKTITHCLNYRQRRNQISLVGINQ